MSSYQFTPLLSDDEYAALKADIAENGVLVPVERDEHGNILDGFNRIKACMELGIETCPFITHRGLTEAQKRTHVRRMNAGHRPLTCKQMRTLIMEQLDDTPDWNARRLANALGLRPSIVAFIIEAERIQSIREQTETQEMT